MRTVTSFASADLPETFLGAPPSNINGPASFLGVIGPSAMVSFSTGEARRSPNVVEVDKGTGSPLLFVVPERLSTFEISGVTEFGGSDVSLIPLVMSTKSCSAAEDGGVSTV